MLGSHVYWTDSRQHALLHADKETGTKLDVLEENLESPMSVAAFSRNKKPGTKQKCMLCVCTPSPPPPANPPSLSKMWQFTL